MRNYLSQNKVLCSLLIINILVNSFFFSLNNLYDSDFFSPFLLAENILKSRIFLYADTFLLKYPLYYLTNALLGFNLSAVALFIFISLITTFGIYLFIYFRLERFLGTLYLPFSLLPVLYIVNQSTIFYHFLAYPIERNFEISILFGLIFYWDFFQGFLKKICLYIILTAFFINDPYFVFNFGLPLLASIILITQSTIKKSYQLDLLIIFTSIITYYFIDNFLSKYTLIYIFPIQIYPLNINDFLPNFIRVFKSFIFIFNIKDFAHLSTIWETLDLINLAVIIFSLIGLGKMFIVGFKSKKLFLVFIPVCYLCTFMVYMFSGNAFNLSSTRYLILLPFTGCFGLLYYLNSVKEKKYFYIINGIIIFAILVNFFSIANFYKIIPSKQKYPNNFKTIDILTKEGVSYGYSDYWHSSINTYISQNNIKIRQIVCRKGKIFPYYLHSSQIWYQPEYHKGKSFLLLSREGKGREDLNNCNDDAILKQFGNPIKSLIIEADQGNPIINSLSPDEPLDNKNLVTMIFDYNIAKKMLPNAY